MTGRRRSEPDETPSCSPKGLSHPTDRPGALCCRPVRCRAHKIALAGTPPGSVPEVTTPVPPTGDAAANRPVPDTADLRILAELVNHNFIGLPEAAWNARMSQQEAAQRLVTMAERGLPLRLVAEGDRQALWRITQAGPATGGVLRADSSSFLPPAAAFLPPAVPGDSTGNPPSPSPAPPPPGGAGVPFGPPAMSAAPGPVISGTGNQPAVFQDPAFRSPAVPATPPVPTGYPPVADEVAPTGGPGPAGTPLANGGPTSPAPNHLSASPHHGPPAVPPVPAPPAAPPVPTPPAQFHRPDPVYPAVYPVSGGPAPWPAPPPVSLPVPPAPPVRSDGPPAAGEYLPPGTPPAAPISAPQPPAALVAAVLSGGIPPIGPVPPHEQAIAGAVPLGEFPFGTPPVGPDSVPAGPAPEATPPTPPAGPADEGRPATSADVRAGEADPGRSGPVSAARSADPGGASADLPVTGQSSSLAPTPHSVWGVPSTAAWIRTDDDATAAPATERPATPAEPDGSSQLDSRAEQIPGAQARTPAPTRLVVPPIPPVLAPPAPTGPPRLGVADPTITGPGSGVSAGPSTRGAHHAPVPDSTFAAPASPGQLELPATEFLPQETTGLFGERLVVTLQKVIDPADAPLIAAGYRTDPTERAVLVQTSVHNAAAIDHESLPDLYLVLIDDNGRALPKAPMSAPGFGNHQMGVRAGQTSSGWTLFFVPADQRVAAVRWSVRPDLAQRTLEWSLPPA